jgi:hypothetical protein
VTRFVAVKKPWNKITCTFLEEKKEKHWPIMWKKSTLKSKIFIVKENIRVNLKD